MKKINFIPDKEINLLENDLLGTSVYVEVLENIIKTTETPYTIGLLGYWGSGKSSIIKTLKEKFNNKGKNFKIRFFVYDAWKYSEDDFRRTFILELKNFFKLDAAKDLEYFYQDKYEDIEHKLVFKKSLWKLLLSLTPLLLVIIWIFNNINNDLKIVTTIISIFLAISLYLSKEMLADYKISVIKPRIFAPEQFENIFKEIAYKVTDKKGSINKWIKPILKKDNKIEKIVIVIDNIDRCNKELAIELLLTIKNFLETENVIFIIPVDDEELKKHLILSNSNANEYLRKIFNTTLQIKNYSNYELFDFAKKLNTNYQLDFSDNILSMAAQEFSKNPRKIIQFLNNLQSEINITKLQEEKNQIPRGAIGEESILTLTKLLIIREEWPEIYSKIIDKPFLLKEINDILNNKTFEKENGQYKIKLASDKELVLDEEQYRFFLRTINIEIENIEIFIFNKDIFSDIPNVIYQQIISQDWDGIKKLINESITNFNDLFSAIDKLINEDIIIRTLVNTSGFNILSLIFKIISDKQYSEELEKLFNFHHFRSIENVISLSEINKLIFQFNVDDLMESVKWFSEKGNAALLDRIIESINEIKPEEYNNKEKLEVIKRFIEINTNNPQILNRIKDNFYDIIKSDFEKSGFNLYPFFKDILEKSEVAKLIYEPEFINTVIQKISYTQTKMPNELEFLRQLNKYNLLSLVNLNNYVQRVITTISPYININANINNLPQVIFWFNSLNGFIEKLKDKNTQNNLFTFLNNFFNNNPNLLQAPNLSGVAIGFLNITKELYLINEDININNKIISWLNTFFVINNKDIYLEVNKIYQYLIERSDNWQFAINIINRFNNIIDNDKDQIAKTLNLMILKADGQEGFNEDSVEQITDGYFNLLFNGNEVITKKTEEWILEIINNKKAKDIILDKISQLINLTQLEKAFNIILKTKDENIIKSSLKKIIDATPLEQLENKINSIPSGAIEYIEFENIFPKLKELLANQKQTIKLSGAKLLCLFSEKISQNRIEDIKILIKDFELKNDLSEECKNSLLGKEILE